MEEEANRRAIIGLRVREVLRSVAYEVSSDGGTKVIFLSALATSPIF
jgi:hypothetical protein